jgi:hypothetical protein
MTGAGTPLPGPPVGLAPSLEAGGGAGADVRSTPSRRENVILDEVAAVRQFAGVDLTWPPTTYRPSRKRHQRRLGLRNRGISASEARGVRAWPLISIGTVVTALTLAEWLSCDKALRPYGARWRAFRGGWSVGVADRQKTHPWLS